MNSLTSGISIELNPSLQITNKKSPAQRKTTLKWDDNGDLTAVDMARIIDRLTTPELNRCELDQS